MDERIGTVAELWRYPVKSMGGERLERAHAGHRGLAGDRGWAVVDTETGKVASAKRPQLWRVLLECRAAYADEPEPDGGPARVRITLPDGGEVLTDDPGRDRLCPRRSAARSPCRAAPAKATARSCRRWMPRAWRSRTPSS